jgi:hypothetical protein
MSFALCTSPYRIGPMLAPYAGDAKYGCLVRNHRPMVHTSKTRLEKCVLPPHLDLQSPYFAQ